MVLIVEFVAIPPYGLGGTILRGLESDLYGSGISRVEFGV